eukprot:760479_1
MSLRFVRVLPKTNRIKLATLQTMQLPFAWMDKNSSENIKQISLEFTNDKAPIFILGHFRSGTTYLHNILSQNPSSLYPTLHTIINQDSYISGDNFLRHLWLNIFPNIFASGTRQFDHVELPLDYPAEDEIIHDTKPVTGPFSNSWHHYQPTFSYRGSDSKFPKEYEYMIKKLLYYNKLNKTNVSDPRLILKA